MNSANKGRRSFWAAAQFFFNKVISQRGTVSRPKSAASRRLCKTITAAGNWFKDQDCAAAKIGCKTIIGAATKTVFKTLTAAGDWFKDQDCAATQTKNICKTVTAAATGIVRKTVTAAATKTVGKTITAARDWFKDQDCAAMQTKNICKTVTAAATGIVRKTITSAPRRNCFQAKNRPAKKIACKTKKAGAAKTVCKTVTVAAAAACAIFLAACKRPLPPQTQYTFGTVCSINLYEAGSAELYARLFGRLRELNDIFNNYSDASEISRVNRDAADMPVEVSQDFFVVLKTALDFAQLTNGAFDPTVGPLVKLWGFGKEPRVPSQEEIAAAKKLVGWQYVALSAGPEGFNGQNAGKTKGFTDQNAGKTKGFTDQNAGGQKSSDKQNASGERESETDQDVAAGPSVRFKKKGIRIDLGAIAKGYAADCLVAILKENNVKRASISLGGNVYVYGKKPGGSLWNVAVRDPNKAGQNAFMLKTQDATVVTSGAYERFFEQDGKIYGHIFDPATGFPAQSGLASVTIVSQTSMVADALSTSLFVLGLEKIPAIKKSALAGNFECVCVDASGAAYASKGLKNSLSALNGQKIVFGEY